VDLWVPRLGCAAYGYPVWLIDNQEKALERAAQSHIQELDRRIEKQQITTDEKKDIV
jgi:3-hydroxyacyl-CoA dehydrogenase